jgi:L,D-peptidoglycan transpeptidase YkuD (ErfK/YbiS/YcfS/YnhG family)
VDGEARAQRSLRSQAGGRRRDAGRRICDRLDGLRDRADPGLHDTYHRLVCGDWWDEDPASPAYNTFRHVACGTRPPFGGGSEALWQAAVAYQQFAVIEYNVHPIVPGRGSAIFLHDDLGRPTNGCVSLPQPELIRVLRWLRPAARPLIVLGTAAEIRGF